MAQTQAQKIWLEKLRSGKLQEWVSEGSNELTHRHNRQDEFNLQADIVKWFRLAYGDEILIAIPNGGEMKDYQRKRYAMAGVTPGVPDMLLLKPNKEYAALFLEMKNGKKGRLSAEQKEIIPRIESKGYKVVVCRTFEDTKKTIEDYLANI